MNERVLYWEIIDICNLKCRYCFYETGVSVRKRKILNKEQFKDVIQEVKKHFNKIVFTGGEALLHPQFFDLVKIAKQSHINLSFITDGLGLTDETIEKSILLSVDSISVSLDSFDATLNGEIRVPKKGDSIKKSQNIIDNVLNLVSKYNDRISIVILQSICRKNIHSIHEISEFSKQFRLKHLVHPVGVPEQINRLDDIDLKKTSISEIELLSNNLYKWAGSDEGLKEYVDITIPFIRGEESENLTCPMGVSDFFSDLEGNLFPCFHRTDLKIGNLFEDNIEELVLKERHQSIIDNSCAHLACTCMLEKSDKL